MQSLHWGVAITDTKGKKVSNFFHVYNIFDDCSQLYKYFNNLMVWTKISLLMIYTFYMSRQILMISTKII